MKCANWILLICLAVARHSDAQERPRASSATVGPERGALVIVGGGSLDRSIREKFIELAGGTDAPIVVIPTAGGGDSYDADSAGLTPWKQLGVSNVAVLHTTDRAQADSEEFVQPLVNARGVWFNGGRQWRLADAYLNTRTHAELWNLLDRGGVIGGTSAGATIQGSYMVRGDMASNTIMMGDHEVALGFLKQSAIDQHVLKRNRHFDLAEVIDKHPELLGIGIDENTAIVVQGDEFEVIGSSYVVIHDAQARVAGSPRGSGGPFYFLAPGDKFDLKTRQPLRKGRRWEPLQRIERAPAERQ